MIDFRKYRPHKRTHAILACHGISIRGICDFCADSNLGCRPTKRGDSLAEDVAADLAKQPDQSWRDPVLKVARDLLEKSI